MGLFEKKYCDLCGDKVNALTRQKLSDGYLCSDCKHKLSSLSSGWKNRTLADVKAHLEQREQNRQKYSAFVQSASAGTNEKLVVDFNNRKFYFTIGRDFKTAILKFLIFHSCRTFGLSLDIQLCRIPTVTEFLMSMTAMITVRAGTAVLAVSLIQQTHFRGKTVCLMFRLHFSRMFVIQTHRHHRKEYLL